MKTTSAKPRSQALEKGSKAGSLSPAQIKSQAMRVSASSRNPPVIDVRKSFGFMPADIQGVVIHWPSL
ncbi:hypothetical protein [Rhodoferax sp.]|uniref:hypothetical protein n=1 Tax=Rhodoferax sp. TaxID=50421 RepID=UPI002609649E|nr:hypothetical protein [Rhodoferax sp.]